MGLCVDFLVMVSCTKKNQMNSSTWIPGIHLFCLFFCNTQLDTDDLMFYWFIVREQKNGPNGNTASDNLPSLDVSLSLLPHLASAEIFKEQAWIKQEEFTNRCTYHWHFDSKLPHLLLYLSARQTRKNTDNWKSYSFTSFAACRKFCGTRVCFAWIRNAKMA